MSYNFKLPSITGKTPDEKLQQLQSYLFKLVADLNYFAGMKGDETAPSVQTAVSDTALSTFQQKLNALQNAIASIRQEIENQPELPAEIEFLEGVTSNLQSQLDDKPNTTDLAKVATSGSYDDLNDKPTIPSLDDVNANINRLLGTVLYEVNPTNGIYCNGKTTVDSVNSATLVDPERVYKRLKIYARFPRGLTCVEFPLDITLKGPDAVFANNNRQGAISFPTGDNVSGATRHYYSVMNFVVHETVSGWTLQITDSGWLGMGISSVSSANYTGNSTAKLSGTEYPHWNQRHNSDYVIYKIVGYKE